MEYKVIGWTDYDDDSFEKGLLEEGDQKYQAIIKDIKDNGYIIFGEWHQERAYCVPVLSDNKKYLFTRRGWGKLMADVMGEEGEFAYALYSDCISLEALKNCKVPDISRSVYGEPNTYLLHLKDKYFDLIQSNDKTIEIRLLKEKIQNIKKGDYIYFLKDGDLRPFDDVEVSYYLDEKTVIKVFVSKKETYNSFVDAFNNIGLDKCGFKGLTVNESVNKMREFYSEEMEKEFAVIALYIEKV